MVIDLEVRPGIGLGKFHLGASLWTILDLLREDPTHYPHIDLKFDQNQPSTSPIILHIRPHLDLLFSPLSQRLHTISARRLRQGPSQPIPSVLTLTYAPHEGETITLSSPSTALRRANVNKVFGPTYPGEVLSFPGVWFAFDEDASAPLPSPPVGGVGGGKSPPVGGAAQVDRNAEVKRVVVCQRTSAKDAFDGMGEVVPCAAMEGELKSVIVEPRLGITLSFHSIPSSQPPPEPIVIRLGETSSQDLICTLGSPLRTFYKEDDRMAIHSNSARGGGEGDEGYFYNYFQYGMDILLSGTTHTVKKIILHSNVPGSFMFQRYQRCPWEIVGTSSSGSPKSASFADRIEKISRILSPSSSNSKGFDPPSMVLDRAADTPSAPMLASGVTKLLGYDGLVLEITDLGDVLTLMMF